MTAAAANEVPKVRAYAARARGVHTAATNSLGDNAEAFMKQAASGMSTSSVRYAVAYPRLK